MIIRTNHHYFMHLVAIIRAVRALRALRALIGAWQSLRSLRLLHSFFVLYSGLRPLYRPLLFAL